MSVSRWSGPWSAAGGWSPWIRIGSAAKDFLFSDDDEEWREVSPATGVRLVLDKLQMRNFDAWLARKVPQLLARLDRCIAGAHDDRPAEPALQAIAGAFGLDAGECALLEYLCALDEVPALRRLLSEVRCQARHQADRGRFLALLAAERNGRQGD